MFVVVLVYGLFVILALWAVISPKSMYWVLTAWQHRNPEANEPSDAGYLVSRIGAAVALVVLVVAGAQLGGAQVRAQAVEDCETVLLPALRNIARKQPVERRAIEKFAADHGLTLKVQSTRMPPYNPPRQPRATRTPTSNGSATPEPPGSTTPEPSASVATAPTVTATRTTRPETIRRTHVTYTFQRDGRTVLTYSEGIYVWSEPGLRCHR